MNLPTVWGITKWLFEDVYSTHPGPEPEAFRAANEAIAPLVPALREETGFLRDNGRRPKGRDTK